VIPGAITPPLAAPPDLPRGGVAARVVAVVCFVAAFAGAWAWLTAWSPFGFERWEVYETSSTVTLEPGTYVVYEEFEGATGPTDREPLNVLVRSIAGREIDVTPLLEPGAGSVSSDPVVPTDDEPQVDAEPYRTPWHEGRPSAWFRLDRAGTYSVTAFSSDSSTTGLEYNELLSSFVAVAPEGRPGALGSTAGLLVVTCVPLALGFAVLALARVRWPRPRSRPPRRRRPTSSASPAR
jgi:hypothetical protein